MSNTQKKFYLTTPIYYVNARPHIGHAYTTIAADVIARRHRLLGDDTFFLTGTDEHGQKIERSAAAAGIPPQQFADQVSSEFRNLWKRMGITNDAYIRTTESRHKRGVQKLFQLLRDRDKIYLSTYTGQYSVGEEMFVEGPPGTIGPDGKPTETVTEENYFFRLSEYQRPLIDLIESGELSIQPEVRKNEVLSFLRGNVANSSVILSEAKNPGISSGAPAISPKDVPTPPSPESVILSEARSAKSKDLRFSNLGNPYVEGALKDLSISRSSFKWGVPVPGDEKHVIYVWLDALANYMTAIGYGSEDPAEQEKFKRYWPADLHLVGKEIIRFHCVYWPAFLLALNPAITGKEPEDVPFEVHRAWAREMLPKAITAHGWLLFEESKMSKSRGNIVRTETILDAFGTLLPNPAEAKSLGTSTASAPGGDSLVTSTALAVPQQTAEGAALAAEVRLPSSEAWKHEQDLFAADVLRYFLLREIPFGQDGSFSFDALVQRYNSDLANGYGNLVSRTLNMIDTSCGAAIPEFPQEMILSGIIENEQGGSVRTTDGVISEVKENIRAYNGFIETYEFSVAVSAPVASIAATDRYISDHKPWKLAKAQDDESQQKLREVLYTAAESIRIITALLYPVMPYATSKVWAQLGLGDIQLASDNGELRNLTWGGLKPGTKLGPLSPIFPRAPKELIQIMTDMETNKAFKSVVFQKSVVENAGLPHVNADLDASTATHTEFRESPISSASVTQALNPVAESTHPIAAHHAEPSATPDTPQIAIDDFVKIDLRVAKIIVAERIPKADKLLRLEVDLGYETRQILSGIAQWYTPEELLGRKIVVIANLAPRKMRGLESRGMLLAASHGEDGKPVLATFGEEIALGSRLK